MMSHQLVHMTVGYNMRTRQHTSVTSNRSTGQKRAVVNYAEQGNQDSGHDSDYKAKLKPPQPLDKKVILQ